MKQTLHITNWFPSKSMPFHGIWINNHINAFHKSKKEYVLWHLEVIPDNPWRLSKTKYSDNVKSIVVHTPLNRWFFIELMTTALLLWILMNTRIKKISHIHFHIAYPLLTYWHLLGKIFRKPIFVSEHWSAYHFNFNVKKSQKLHRIRRIFTNEMTLMPVSKSLKNDIEIFSNKTLQNCMIIPNIVDTSVFYKSLRANKKKGFFMLSGWKKPKNPFPIIEAFAEFCQTQHEYHLYIGGHGELLPEIEECIIKNNIQNKISFLGTLSPHEVSCYMNLCEAFLHGSEYETFSVVCAEAIACGTPVIASNVGGIPEFINSTNGILVAQNDKKEWLEALQAFIEQKDSYNPNDISRKAHARFSPESIRNIYQNAINQLRK